jgi:acyl CoA:acetate/3-ketoacid CoA transferase alpha subunit
MKKGFGSEEIPELVDDLKLLLQQPENRTTVYVNQELESLGWGVQLLDESLFQMIVSHLISSDEFTKSMERGEVRR